MRRIVTVGLGLLLAATPVPAMGEDRDILASAERLSAAVEPNPDAAGGSRSTAKIATTLALVGAGIGMVLAGNPEYVPSRFAPGNTPQRVDLGIYLGEGQLPGPPLPDHIPAR